ncbi:hypothetical protein CRG98_001418 [Punica granatum]|uniref:Uncharacterized protein n=1 Tax=Punica granatum TaxID=22663 RepID=A0A2I0LBX8_PUNGR|nr:hypothetical protein CRG98_001418 [Punica granatum]
MNAHLAIPSPPQALLSTSLPSNCEDPPCPADMIQLEDHSHGLEEESQDDRVRHKGELWDKHVQARASTRARAKRIQHAMRRLLLHAHGGIVELLGGLHVELEVTTVHILEIYLEDDLSSKG